MIPTLTILDKASDLKPEALSFLFSTDQDFFPTPWSQESWEKVFQTHQDRLILMAENLGFALFDFSNADSFAHLLKIVTIPTCRGQGVGKKLLNEAIRILKERGIKSFFLEVEEGNTPAQKLYESMGFKVIHHKKQFYSNGAAALIMTLDV